MKEPVLKAVCRPPEIFKAPFNLFFVNFIINIVLMLLFIVLNEITGGKNAILSTLGFPLVWIGTMLGAHIILMGLQAKDPHVATLIMTFAQSPKGTKNAVKHKGDKFSP